MRNRSTFAELSQLVTTYSSMAECQDHLWNSQIVNPLQCTMLLTDCSKSDLGSDLHVCTSQPLTHLLPSAFPKVCRPQSALSAWSCQNTCHRLPFTTICCCAGALCSAGQISRHPTLLQRGVEKPRDVNLYNPDSQGTSHLNPEVSTHLFMFVCTGSTHTT